MTCHVKFVYRLVSIMLFPNTGLVIDSVKVIKCYFLCLANLVHLRSAAPKWKSNHSLLTLERRSKTGAIACTNRAKRCVLSNPFVPSVCGWLAHG